MVLEIPKGHMRKVAIIGGSQAGLQLALGLLQNKYEVTLVSSRTPEPILCGRVTSSQFMFHDSLQNERDLVINFWEKKCPITGASRSPFPGRTRPRLCSGRHGREALWPPDPER